MKTKLILTLLLAAFAAHAGQPKTVWIGVSPHLDTKRLQDAYDAVHKLCMDLPLETQVHVVSGSGHIATVAQFKTPANVNAKGKTRAVNAQLQPVLDWLQAASRDADNRETGELDLPEMLKEFDGEFKPGADLILIGSTIYRTPEKDLSFFDEEAEEARDRFKRPSHAHLKVPDSVSPFGLLGREFRLSGVKVHWWNPFPKETWGKQTFRQELEAFWTLYSNLQGADFLGIGSDGMKTLKSAVEGKGRKQTAKLDPDEATLKMVIVTRDEFLTTTKTNWMDYVNLGRTLPQVSDVLVVDNSYSMGGYYETIARRLSLQKRRPGQRRGLVLFNDHPSDPPAFWYSESYDPLEIAEAMREIPLVGGFTHPEAVADALYVVQTKLRERKNGPSSIRIYTDNVAKPAGECECGRDYVKLMASLIRDGHRITVVRCGAKVGTDWVPAGVQVIDLDDE